MDGNIKIGYSDRFKETVNKLKGIQSDSGATINATILPESSASIRIRPGQDIFTSDSSVSAINYTNENTINAKSILSSDTALSKFFEEYKDEYERAQKDGAEFSENVNELYFFIKKRLET